MIEPQHPALSIGAQCRLLSIARSSFYYEPLGETEMNLELMRRIDRQFLETPFYGVRQMAWHLENEGYPVNVKRVRRLMRLMGLMPIYQKPDTSKPAKGHKTYPYLLRGLRIDRPNQVWCADITYLPMRRGFLYLVAIMDWATRKVLAWRISMDGKGRYIDNIFIERLWRSLKYECVYLHAWETGSQARAGIGRWITFYNHQRPHAAHGGRSPAVVYWNTINQTDQQTRRVA